MHNLKYLIRPLDQGYVSSFNLLHSPANILIYPSANVKIETHGTHKRWGYLEDRDLGTGVDVLGIATFTKKDPSKSYTLYLTDSDLCKKETAPKTFSYITETYVEGNITTIDGITVTGAGTDWDGNVAKDDYFVLNDDHTSDAEPDTSWRKILSVNGTTIVLTAAYEKNITGQTKSYKIRKVYTVPTDEYWSWAIVGDLFCFSNGNVNVQYWDGDTDYASDLDSTNAIKARYLTEYAERLILVDYGSTRDPLGIAWSKNNDPATWDDTTSGSAQFLTTEDFLTGAGVIGQNLMLYKKKSYIIGNRSGISTAPIYFTRKRYGYGVYAPYSVVTYMGTQAFLGEDNFYMVVGSVLEPIGDDIRDFFFDNVTMTNAAKTYGFVNMTERELIWIANAGATKGVLAFVYNWQEKKWYIYSYADTIKCGGLGADAVYYLGDDDGKVYTYSDDCKGDDGSNIISQSVSSALNIPDQIQQISGHLFTVYEVKLTYVDHGNVSTIVSVSADGGESWSSDTQTIGTAGADGTVKSTTFPFIVTGEFFNIKVYHTGKALTFEWLELTVGLVPSGDIT